MKRIMTRLGLLFTMVNCCAWLHAQITVTTLTPPFDGSGGLELDYNGNLYIADFGASLDNGNGTVVNKLLPDGTLEVFAVGLQGASGNDFDQAGNLFQSNIQAGTVSKISPTGLVTTFASNGISCNVGIVIDEDDNLFVCNCCAENGNTIRKVTPTGTSTLFSNSPLLRCPNGITQDATGHLYISNFGNGNIIKITPNGIASVLATTPSGSILSASNGHIIYDTKRDVLYVASHATHKIYKLTLDGILSELAGSGIRGNQDGTAAAASFSRPNGLAISPTGDSLYVNSSIPTTNSGGRPLNPSVVRLIRGLNPGISASEEVEHSIIFESITVFPNPISGDQLEIKFKVDHAQSVQIILMDMDGNQIAEIMNEKIIENQHIRYDVGHLLNGNYLLSIKLNQSYKTEMFSIIK
jgi:sugar lactone lactonase YvrE